jgi:NitT/TauT family transport system substrate-binding protein
MNWPKGHVECIIIAKDSSIKNKKEALKELVEFIHKSGDDIEKAKDKGGKSLEDIAEIIEKYIPKHRKKAVIQSLRKDLDVINYKNLNIDKDGLKYIMDLAIEGNILDHPISIDNFASDEFIIQNK